ncbi:MAG: hypothetical protein PWQ16_863 [bacterium]|nr:hypothetical protein [bacterium]
MRRAVAFKVFSLKKEKKRIGARISRAVTRDQLIFDFLARSRKSGAGFFVTVSLNLRRCLNREFIRRPERKAGDQNVTKQGDSHPSRQRDNKDRT